VNPAVTNVGQVQMTESPDQTVKPVQTNNPANGINTNASKTGRCRGTFKQWRLASGECLQTKITSRRW